MLVRLAAVMLLFLLAVACGDSPPPTEAPTLAPTAASVPAPTVQTSTAGPTPTPTAIKAGPARPLPETHANTRYCCSNTCYSCSAKSNGNPATCAY